MDARVSFRLPLVPVLRCPRLLLSHTTVFCRRMLSWSILKTVVILTENIIEVRQKSTLIGRTLFSWEDRQEADGHDSVKQFFHAASGVATAASRVPPLVISVI